MLWHSKNCCSNPLGIAWPKKIPAIVHQQSPNGTWCIRGRLKGSVSRNEICINLGSGEFHRLGSSQLLNQGTHHFVQLIGLVTRLVGQKLLNQGTHHSGQLIGLVTRLVDQTVKISFQSKSRFPTNTLLKCSGRDLWSSSSADWSSPALYNRFFEESCPARRDVDCIPQETLDCLETWESRLASKNADVPLQPLLL